MHLIFSRVRRNHPIYIYIYNSRKRKIIEEKENKQNFVGKNQKKLVGGADANVKVEFVRKKKGKY